MQDQDWSTQQVASSRLAVPIFTAVTELAFPNRNDFPIKLIEIILSLIQKLVHFLFLVPI